MPFSHSQALNLIVSMICCRFPLSSLKIIWFMCIQIIAAQVTHHANLTLLPLKPRACSRSVECRSQGVVAVSLSKRNIPSKSDKRTCRRRTNGSNFLLPGYKNNNTTKLLTLPFSFSFKQILNMETCLRLVN